MRFSANGQEEKHTTNTNFIVTCHWHFAPEQGVETGYDSKLHFIFGLCCLLIGYISFLLVWFCNFLQFVFFFPRYQDENTQAFFMVVSSNRWLSVRLDLLSSVFITAVAVAAILVAENPGELVKAILLAIIERYKNKIFIWKYFMGHKRARFLEFIEVPMK